MALLDTTNISAVHAAVASGVGTTNSSGVNAEGFDGVGFLVILDSALISSVVTVQLQESPDNATWVNAGAAVSYTATAALTAPGVILADLNRPVQQYVRAVVTVATAAATIDSILAVQYRGKNNPTAQAGLLASSWQESV